MPNFEIKIQNSQLETDGTWEKRLSSPRKTVVCAHNQKGFDVHIPSSDKKPLHLFVEGKYSDEKGDGELKVSDLSTKLKGTKEVCKDIEVDEADTVLCFLALKGKIPTETQVWDVVKKEEFGGSVVVMDREMIRSWCGPLFVGVAS
jgi:hypothetical protein